VSFSDKPSFDQTRMLGCIAFGVLALVLVCVAFFLAAMGDCPINNDGTGCENDGIKRFLLFPGSAVIALPSVFLVARWAMRNERDD
jgi:hypothetical protein